MSDRDDRLREQARLLRFLADQVERGQAAGEFDVNTDYPEGATWEISIRTTERPDALWGLPRVGDRWRFRDGAGSVVTIVEVTDRAVRYVLGDDGSTTFGNQVETWAKYFEPAPAVN